MGESARDGDPERGLVDPPISPFHGSLCSTDPSIWMRERLLELILVAYHPSEPEITQLMACLAALSPGIGYAVVVNDHTPGEPVERLREGADLFLALPENPGYGRAVNRGVAALAELAPLPTLLGALNTDLSWSPGSFEALSTWLGDHPEIAIATPRILSPHGETQHLCKRNPTLLGLLSRRFLPPALKPAWLKRYDNWYAMKQKNYDEIFDVPYLSGCCMLMRSAAFQQSGGFDEAFFLYLEDADLTRAMRLQGRAIHLPIASVRHHWGRGNYHSLKLMLVNFHSAWIYFRKWGLALW